MPKQKSNTKISTRLTAAIEATDEKKMYDESCKKILADKTILAFIMKECVAEYADVDINSIAERYIEGNPDIGTTEILTGKTIQGLPNELIDSNNRKIFFDIKYRAIAPKDNEYIQLIINVEAQNDQYPGYPLVKRGIFYDCLMISNQYGTMFDKLDYNNLKKVYSIWLCRNVPKKLANSITVYEMRERNIVGDVKEKKENYDLLTVVMVHLGEAEDKRTSDMLNLLNRLFSDKVRASEKLEILEREYQILPSEELEREVVEMCNWSKTVEDTAGKRGFERGHAKGHAVGHAVGHATGHAVGHAVGHAEGHAKGKFEMAKDLISQGFPKEAVLKSAGISIEEFADLIEMN